MQEIFQAISKSTLSNSFIWQRQILAKNYTTYNLSFQVNTLTTSRVGFRLTSSETDAETEFP